MTRRLFNPFLLLLARLTDPELARPGFTSRVDSLQDSLEKNNEATASLGSEVALSAMCP